MTSILSTHIVTLEKMEAQKYRAYSLVLIFDHKNISIDRRYLKLFVCVCTHTRTCDVICPIMCVIDVINLGPETSVKGSPETWERIQKKKKKERKMQGNAGEKQIALNSSNYM